MALQMSDCRQFIVLFPQRQMHKWLLACVCEFSIFPFVVVIIIIIFMFCFDCIFITLLLVVAAKLERTLYSVVLIALVGGS